jgi:hypothetical protein
MYIEDERYTTETTKYYLGGSDKYQDELYATVELKSSKEKESVKITFEEKEITQLFEGLFTFQGNDAGSIDTKFDMVKSLASDQEIVTIAKMILENRANEILRNTKSVCNNLEKIAKI